MNKQQVFNEEENRKADRHALIQSLGIEYSAKFVPLSQSRNVKEKDKSLNWLVTIKRGNSSLTTNYMQGIGHLKGFSQPYGKGLSISDTYALDRSVQSGIIFSHVTGETRRIPGPNLEDVLYSLLLDASVLDSPTFEDWAGEFGYDTDSRKSEKLYNACLEIALKMRALLGDENLRKLHDLYQGY